ncbi:MAG TPA: DNA-processing protein DprA, partial [Burkholderiales bacterium]|nr:DNA-processing protein DprA [Burkholderiales bacterium]
KAFAIVGSRNATPQGMENARSFARTLSDVGLCIVSGMALGIDSAAHEGGLAGASGSIAVVGTGLDIVYPSRNRGLAAELEAKGLLVSEFPLGTPPIGSNFPRRNRIISGLCIGCLVVEAGIRSGSLITARHALEQGREVFAIPGSIHSPLSKGPHRLIKEGAKLVESGQDILEELRLSSGGTSREEAGAETSDLLERMGFDPVDSDTLCERTGLSPQRVSSRLLELEMEGSVCSLPGGMYQRIH